MKTIEKRKIKDIVADNYIYASVLYYFGIEFYNYSNLTLEQACQNNGLNVISVVSSLEKKEIAEAHVDVSQLPIDLIVEYLKHTHFVFIKQKLPYVGSLIAHLKASKSAYQSIAKDLKFVFPLFVEDFIHHIYQEEDTLFNYIAKLDAYTKGKGHLSHLYLEMEQNNLANFASEHEEHDDEMMGIRQITNNYSLNESSPLHIKVVYSELKDLEDELKTHARIENEILFPKALMLEKNVRMLMREKVRYN